jgi:predicted MFS family arabinose efflux permease
VSRPIARRNLIRGPLLAAAVSSLIASAGVLFLAASTAVAWIVAVTVIFGITTGTTTIGNQAALYTQVTPAQIGTASGLFRTSTYIGSIASATITSLVFRTQVSDHGLHQIAVILTAASVVILLMTLADRRIHARPRGTTGQPDAATAKNSPVPGRP